MDSKIVDNRMPYLDASILEAARTHCVTPSGFVRKVRVTTAKSAPSTAANQLVPEVGVSARALFLHELLDDEIADAVERRWGASHLDQVRWAAYLLRNAGTAWQPTQSTCTVGSLTSRLQRSAKFLGIPNAGEVCPGAVIVACRLQRIDLWPMGSETDAFRIWKVGIHTAFRFPGELPPRKSLAGAYEAKYPRKRR
jgi:hypothetical protein